MRNLYRFNSTNLKLLIATIIAVAMVGQTGLAQTFDEQFETWPVDLRIRGSVIVSGGGDTNTEIAKLFLDMAGSDSANIAVLKFNSKSDSPDFESLFESAKSVQVIEIDHDAKQLSEESIQSINSASGVWLEASRVLSVEQNQLIAKHSELFRAVTERGGSVFAGPGLAGSTGKIYRSGFAGLEVTSKEMNLVPDSVIYPGFDETRDRNELLGVLAANPRMVGIGIQEDTCLVLRGRQVRIVGGGQASFYLAANEWKPLRVQHVKQAESRRANPYEYAVDLTAWRRDAIDRTLPRFPKLAPNEPFVENGTLIIIGGGGIPEGLMEQMVVLAGGKKARMVYVPCTEQAEVPSENRMLEIWNSMGVESASVFHTKDRNRANSDEEFLKPLKDATGIWFGGGRQWNFSDSYYGTKAHQLMKDVLDRGGVIAGSSAGASIQGRYLARANPLANFDIMADGYERGLGFIDGVAIDQHFTQRGRQKDMTQLANRYPQLLGIGIDETTALVVSKSKAEVVGKGDVYFYDRSNPVIPGENDFIKVAAGSTFDLRERQVVESAPAEQSEWLLDPDLDSTKKSSKQDSDGKATAEQASSSPNWYHWRGPLANGSLPDAKPPINWNDEDGARKNIAWKVAIDGEGSSTPVVVGDKIFLSSAVATDREMEAIPNKDSRSMTIPPRNYFQFTVWCVDRKSGAVIWKDIATEAVPHEGKHKSHTYAAGSPVTDGKHVYFSFGSQGIFCYDLEGNKIWERDLGDMRTRRGWGEASTPALYGNRLVVIWDHEDESKIFVLDSKTGETVWEKARDEPTTWATPLVTTFENRVQVITNGTNSVVSYDLENGDVIWEAIGTTLNAIPCPVRYKDTVICMAGYQGNRAISINLNSRGKVEVEALNWRIGKNTPYVPSPALSGNRLYFTKGNSAIISCIDAGTGKTIFDASRIEGLANLYASPVVAGGHVFVVSREGVVAVLKDADTYELVATNQMSEPIDASPVVVGNSILLRGNKHLFCVQEDE